MPVLSSRTGKRHNAATVVKRVVHIAATSVQLWGKETTGKWEGPLCGDDMLKLLAGGSKGDAAGSDETQGGSQKRLQGLGRVHCGELYHVRVLVRWLFLSC